MFSTIFELSEDSGVIKRRAEYSLSPREALRNYIMQMIFNNANWWDYPDTVDGMRKSKYGWYWDDIKNGKVLAAYPM